MAGCLFAAGLIAQSAPVVQIATTDISCAGQKDGQLELTLLSGTVPVDFQWLNLITGAQGTGQFALAGQPILLTSLDGGLYRFSFTAADGTDTTLQRAVVEPPPLLVKLVPTTGLNGFQLICAGSQDGVVLCEATGGSLPLFYNWSNGDNGTLADSLPAGPVALTVSDIRGCTVEADTTLTAPPPIVSQLRVVGETCFGQNSGVIGIETVNGGVPPYRFALGNNPAGPTRVWTDLPHGQYFLSIIDAIGCEHKEAAILPSGLEFILQLGPDTAMLSGDSLRLSIYTDPPADTLIWQPNTGFHQLSPEEILFFPRFSMTYQVTALTADGCVTTDELHITVNRDRNIYLPNVFAPQAQEADNQAFTVYGSAGIRTVSLLRVYDRFGRLWFENRNFPVNDPGSGWRGSDGADLAPPGVYLWHVLLLYTDGRIVEKLGDVTLIR